ncbi:MAG TPA: nuclear transport factor 2 family protein [Candidatus Limnocylindria bacterium]|nr:nuclear transport factor 2 family protein [Candidatus Limnocylindria bacterium]
MTNEQVVRQYAEAMMRHDFDTLARLRHPEWTAVWPQSGEVVRSSAMDRQMMESYPGGMPSLAQQRLVGSEDRWALSPLGGVYRVAGEGENWWGEWRMTYPEGRTWFTLVLIELRDGKVYCETVYWAEPFEAPEWRAQFVERLVPDREGA